MLEGIEYFNPQIKSAGRVNVTDGGYRTIGSCELELIESGKGGFVMSSASARYIFKQPFRLNGTSQPGYVLFHVRNTSGRALHIMLSLKFMVGDITAFARMRKLYVYNDDMQRLDIQPELHPNPDHYLGRFTFVELPYGFSGWVAFPCTEYNISQRSSQNEGCLEMQGYDSSLWFSLTSHTSAAYAHYLEIMLVSPPDKHSGSVALCGLQYIDKPLSIPEPMPTEDITPQNIRNILTDPSDSVSITAENGEGILADKGRYYYATRGMVIYKCRNMTLKDAGNYVCHRIVYDEVAPDCTVRPAFLEKMYICFSVSEADYPLISGLFENVADAMKANDELLAKGYMFMLMSHLTKKVYAVSTTANLLAPHYKYTNYAIILRAQSILEEEYQNNISLSYLSSRCGISSEHLCRTFTRITGISPMRRLEQIRINHACELMQNGAPPEQACNACGFSGLTVFYAAFKRVKGCTPRTYLRLTECENAGHHGQ